MFERIHRHLSGHARASLPAEGLTEAAVLVPVFARGGEGHLLMGKRTDLVLQHKGQVAFPGGVRDPQDADAKATALREAFEEFGLRPEDVTVLGLLSDIQTVTGFRVTPVVGRIPFPYDFKLNPAEVQEVLLVPWRTFAEGPGHRREELVQDGKPYDVDFYDFGGHVIWGATARITREFMELVGEDLVGRGEEG